MSLPSQSTHTERCSISRALLQLSLRVLVDWTPLHDSQQVPYGGRCLSLEPSSVHKSPVDESLSRFPSRTSTESDVRPLSPPPHILPDPQQRSPFPRFTNRAPAGRDAPFLEPSFSYFSKFLVNGLPPPLQVPQWDPYGERHPFPELCSTHPLLIHLSLKVPGK
jgi:hypothetical protein